MMPQFLPPPEFAAAHPPAWVVAGTLLLSVLFSAGFTCVVLPA